MPGTSRPPLDPSEPSIRLLEPERYSDEPGELRYTLTSYKFSACPPYRALSYTCGSPCHTDTAHAFSSFNYDLYPGFKDFLDLESDWSSYNHAIFCNGQEHRVRLNLYDALIELRNRWEGGPLWVDAICIDTNDDQERASQVALMAKIYGQARTIFVWLGKEGQDSTNAKEIQDTFAGPIYSLYEQGKLSWDDMSRHNPFEKSYFTEYELSTTLLTSWFSWACFFRRSYFTRCWTLQEITLAQRVQILCGNQTLDWLKLSFLVQYFRHSGWKAYHTRYLSSVNNYPLHALLATYFTRSILADTEAWLQECYDVYQTTEFASTLCEMLYRTSELDCYDPRDKIFAMYAILQKASRDSNIPIDVDYGCDVAELYQKITVLCLQSLPDLSILSLVRDNSSSGRQIDGLPSWVPDLHANASEITPHRLALDRRRPRGPIYNAAFKTPMGEVYRTVGNGELCLKAQRMGRIKNLSLPYEQVDLLWSDFLCRMAGVCADLPNTLRNGQSRLEGLWRTLTGDNDTMNHTSPAPAELGPLFSDFILSYLFASREAESLDAVIKTCNHLSQICVDEQDMALLPQLRDSDFWFQRLTQPWETNSAHNELNRHNVFERFLKFKLHVQLAQNALYATDEGDIGYAPPNTVAGDEIWVLENGRAPFVLRSQTNQDEDRQQYQLIGECYLHGIMLGELFEDGKPEYEIVSLV